MSGFSRSVDRLVDLEEAAADEEYLTQGLKGELLKNGGLDCRLRPAIGAALPS